MLAIRSFGTTDTGLLRTLNEDCFDANDTAQVYVVADGMGGHNHGEVASRLAVRSVREKLTGGRTIPAPAGGGVQPRLRRSIEFAHEQICAAMRDDTGLLGMGTTIVCAMLSGQRLIIGHVGDSRAYRRRGGLLELLTNDHTWVYQQVLAGFLSEAEALQHPLRSVVTRALGGDDSGADITEADARAGDLFLLCSDGLNSMLTDDEIGAWLGADASLEEICYGLVNAANANGGIDNVTVVLLRVLELEPVHVPQPAAEARAASAA